MRQGKSRAHYRSFTQSRAIIAGVEELDIIRQGTGLTDGVSVNLRQRGIDILSSASYDDKNVAYQRCCINSGFLSAAVFVAYII
ncbi:MAG: hypothetical protein LUD07_07690 [Clostridiales bacterium]|nr:hypothetical protein [Clostridiales bacterium]